MSTMAMPRQLGLYALVGVAGTALHYAVLALLVFLGVDAVVGTTIGAVAGAPVAVHRDVCCDPCG